MGSPWLGNREGGGKPLVRRGTDDPHYKNCSVPSHSNSVPFFLPTTPSHLFVKGSAPLGTSAILEAPKSRDSVRSGFARAITPIWSYPLRFVLGLHTTLNTRRPPWSRAKTPLPPPLKARRSELKKSPCLLTLGPGPYNCKGDEYGELARAVGAYRSLHHNACAISFISPDSGPHCSRKKIKCDGCEPTCSQCTASGSQCTWLQTKDRAALSRQYVIAILFVGMSLTRCTVMSRSSRPACCTWNHSFNRSHPSFKPRANP
jgi:hypothetical protein